MLSGVPQGGVLSPLPNLLCFITPDNRVPRAGCPVKYADDLPLKKTRWANCFVAPNLLLMQWLVWGNITLWLQTTKKGYGDHLLERGRKI